MPLAVALLSLRIKKEKREKRECQETFPRCWAPTEYQKVQLFVLSKRLLVVLEQNNTAQYLQSSLQYLSFLAFSDNVQLFSYLLSKPRCLELLGKHKYTHQLLRDTNVYSLHCQTHMDWYLKEP